MKDRLKKVRKSFPEHGKNQETFAKFLGIPQSNLASYETGRRIPSDAAIQLYCQKCGISDKWLRTGEGDMKIEDCKDNRYLSNVGKLQRADDETIMHWVNAIAETDPKVLKQIEEFMKKLLEIQED